MNYQPSDTHAYVAAHVMNFARHIIDRADDRIGGMARRQMLHICDTQASLAEALHREFGRIGAPTDTAILDSPTFMGMLRGANLRRLAGAAHVEHEAFIWTLRNPADELLTYHERIRRNAEQTRLADNPNAFKNMAHFLNIVADVNDEFAKGGCLVNPVEAAAMAQEHIADAWLRFARPSTVLKSQPRMPRL